MTMAAWSLERREKQQLINLHELISHLEFWNGWRHGKRISYFCASRACFFGTLSHQPALLLPSTPAELSQVNA